MDINRYSLSALEERGNTIKNYRRYDQSGLTIIEYDFIDRSQGMATGTLVGVGGAVAGLGVGVGASILFPPAAPFILIGSLWGGPVGGAVTGYAIGKSVPKKHYFSPSSGDYLGDTQSDAAQKMYEQGTVLFKKGNFENANKCFHNSYSNVSHTLYREAKEASDRALEGIRLLETGKLETGGSAASSFSAAHEKFSEAYNMSNETMSADFKHCLDATNAASEAASYVAAGNILEALNKFREAHNTTNNFRIQNVFSKYIEATQLGSDGQTLFSQGHFTEAEAKFKQANNKLTNTTDVFSKCAEASRAASEALYQLKLGNFGAAEEKFGNILRGNLIMVVRNTLRQYSSISMMASEALFHLKQANFSAAKAEFLKAKNATDITELRNMFSNFTLASKSASEGYKLWNEGWELEEIEDESETDRSEEAKRKFKQAKEKFNEALDFEKAGKVQQTSEHDSKRVVFYNWVTIASLKIEGNDLFNEGAKLQDEANKLCRMNKYKLACEKYEEAVKKFKEGLRLSQDQRFQTCVDFAEECLEETKKRFALIGLSHNLSGLSTGETRNEVIDDGTYQGEVDKSFRVI